jgi:glycosyltransferase involved in cell wall biosynthesis
MSEPLVSVVTPTKNRLRLLLETMKSVQHQTLTRWEHIIVDDGSDDGTAEDVPRRVDTDPRLRYLPRMGERTGANVCRNQGLAAAVADLIVFLDSDDVLEPNCLARRVEIMQRNQDLDFIVSGMGAFVNTPGDVDRDHGNDLLGDDLLGFLYFELPWQTTGPTWRRQTLERLGGFDEELPSWQDVDLHVRALATGCRYLRVPDVDYHMRWQMDHAKVSIMQRRAPDHLKMAEQTLAKFERVVRDGPGMTWVRQRALCSLYFFIAECWSDAGRLSDSLRCWGLIRDRKLGSRFLYGTGAGVLALHATGEHGKRLLGRRIGHKWKGWMRLRTNPELVAGQK